MRQTNAMCLDHISYVASQNWLVDSDKLSDYWLNSKTSLSLKSADIEFNYSSTNYADFRIMATHPMRPSAVVRLD